jgi:hypothetical protein
LMLGGGALQHFRRVVTDADKLDTGRFDFLQVGLQLN